MVLDACCKTINTGRACLLLPYHRRFVGVERDRNCVAESMTFLSKTLARQQQNKIWDLTASKGVSEVD